MAELTNLTVLIVDPAGTNGYDFRKSFVDAGAEAHVVGNFSIAEKIVQTKKIDAAILPYAKDAETIGFCRLLTLANIPCIFTAEPPPRYPTRKPMAEAILAVQALVARQHPPRPTLPT